MFRLGSCFAFRSLVVCLWLLLPVSAMAAGLSLPITLDPATAKGATVQIQSDGTVQITLVEANASVESKALPTPVDPKEHRVFSLDYLAVTGLKELRVWFGPTWDRPHSSGIRLPSSEGWVPFSLDFSKRPEVVRAGATVLRFDFAGTKGRVFQMRNLRLRGFSPQEVAREQAIVRKKAEDEKLDKRLHAYLATNFPGRIERVSVGTNTITVEGRYSGPTKNVMLCEDPIWTFTCDARHLTPVAGVTVENETFSVTIPRISTEKTPRDRLFSRWVIARLQDDQWTLRSHAHYADDITPFRDVPRERPRSKKGIGGFHAGRETSDLDALNIGSVTLNLQPGQFLRSQPGPDNDPIVFQGKTYYINRKAVAGLDASLQETAKRHIVVLAIILINKAEQWPDKALGKLIQHPDYDPAGIFPMPNVTTGPSLDAYAAVMNFLAERYSRPGQPHGRIHHWIMHNEVDAGWVWTNCGEKPPLLYLDQYHKSMRTVYLAARQWDANAQVFISLTHYWTQTGEPKFLLPRDLLNYLLEFSRAEGDFDWGIAYHPYPESLFEPKAWNDKKAEFTLSTPYITPKNIEVLDAWTRQPHTLYRGKVRRPIHLSEQGANSRDYSDTALAEQAAGAAYMWKKIKDLDGIQGFQWHNWYDNKGEGGLRIGLRRFPQPPDNGAIKPAWTVWQKAGTPEEDAAFEFAKPIIGITNWSEVPYRGPIPP